jgi:hypothetical protein
MIQDEKVNDLKLQAEILVKKIQSLKHYLKSSRATTHVQHAIQEVTHG